MEFTHRNLSLWHGKKAWCMVLASLLSPRSSFIVSGWAAWAQCRKSRQTLTLSLIYVSDCWADRSPLHEAAAQGRLLALKTLIAQVSKLKIWFFELMLKSSIILFFLLFFSKHHSLLTFTVAEILLAVSGSQNCLIFCPVPSFFFWASFIYSVISSVGSSTLAHLLSCWPNQRRAYIWLKKKKKIIQSYLQRDGGTYLF